MVCDEENIPFQVKNTYLFVNIVSEYNVSLNQGCDLLKDHDKP